MENHELIKLSDILSKINKTQSMIKGIRLGISVSSSASQPMQNIEDIFKLINADLQEISNNLISLTNKNIDEENTILEKQEIDDGNN